MSFLFNSKILKKEIALVEVLIPAHLDSSLTYLVPDNFLEKIILGGRVIVPLGRTKFCGGIVIKKYLGTADLKVKEILEVVDEKPILDLDTQLNFFFWVAKYYLCKIGEVLKLALPGSLKISSDTKIQVHKDFDGDCTGFSLEEEEMLKIISNSKIISLENLKKIYDKKKFHKTLQSLYEKKIVHIEEEIKKNYSPKILKKITVSSGYRNKDSINKIILELEKFPKQQDIILTYLTEIHKNQNGDFFIEKSKLQGENFSLSSLKTLLRKEILEEKLFMVPRFSFQEKNLRSEPLLSEEQKICYKKIIEELKVYDIVLLHGVTGSGKTEILIKLIFQILKNDKQVLYLLPEIAITSQLVNRIRAFFGEKVLVYHSKFSSQERAEVWQNVINGEPKVIIGVRSSIFLPFKNLDLIIIDEEHDLSYKNSLNHPRYNGRDAALILAKKHKAKTILSSATPSIWSYYNAAIKKFGLVKIESRYGDAKFPEVELVNISYEKRLKKMNEEFSERLTTEIKNSLEKNEQTIIFQNKRGYAVYISCMGCSNVPTCINCAVTLTYYHARDYLKCNFCRYTINYSPVCNICKSHNIKNFGFGTEKIEESLQNIFPHAKIARMDSETTSSKKKLEKLLKNIENLNVDIIVGTQMIVKGFDFPKVTTIGIIQADHLLYMPDYSANERAFNTIYQLVGRGGRSNLKSKVIIQTCNTKNKILKAIKNNSYEDMYSEEIIERKKYDYPPFFRLIKISMMHKNIEYLKNASGILFEKLCSSIAFVKISPPTSPLIGKINQFFIHEIWIKISMGNDKRNITLCKSKISFAIKNMTINKEFNKCKIVLDVDA